MPETEHSQDNLAAVRTHLNNLEQMLRFNTATNPNNRAAVTALFSEGPGRAELYLALEGEPKTQPELAAALGVNQSTVSRGLKVLLDAGLAVAIPAGGTRRATTYMRSSVESLIGVSRLARAHIAAAAKAIEGKTKRARRGRQTTEGTGATVRVAEATAVGSDGAGAEEE